MDEKREHDTLPQAENGNDHKRVKLGGAEEQSVAGHKTHAETPTESERESHSSPRSEGPRSEGENVTKSEPSEAPGRNSQVEIKIEPEDADVNMEDAYSNATGAESAESKQARDVKEVVELPGAEDVDLRETKDNEWKERKKAKESEESKESEEAKQSEELKDKEVNDSNDSKDSRESKDTKESKESNDSRESNGSNDSKDSKESKDSKDSKPKESVAAAAVVVPPKKPELFYSPLKTGLVYDVRMRYHAKIFTSYFEYIDPHPEDPRRIYRIYKKLAEAGLIQDASLSGAEELGDLMVKIPIREASADEILEVHTADHLRYIALTEAMTRAQLLDETEKGDSIYVNNDLFLLAKLLCGGAIEACAAVVEGRVKNALAIVRPPGHHAEPDAPGGFCLFSNVAVAAKNILKAYPDLVRRIVILDWDIHHGNGTQRAFYDDPRVLYMSLHRYENGKFYPGTRFGGHDKTGAGAGEGYSVNVPWQSAGVGDADYMYAFRRVIVPIIGEFDPDLVIVSAGFDAAAGDLIGQCHVSPAGYGHMTHMLKSIARGKLTVVLEGGYNLDSISTSALAVAKVLVGEPPEATILLLPRLDVLETVSEVVRTHAKYWRCMRPGHPAHAADDVYDAPADSVTAVAEPVRLYQAHELFASRGFAALPILDTPGDKASAFSSDWPPHVDDLILASPNISDCTTLVVCIHDPPEVWAAVNPVSGTIDTSALVVLQHPLARVVDRLLAEVAADNAAERVGYIDINIPSYTEAMAAALKPATKGKVSSYSPAIFAQELLLWVWDNYLGYFADAKKVVFVGYGDAYHAIVHLYAKRPSQEIKDLVQATVVFVGRSPLKPLVPVMDESMVDWYYQNSVLFTGCMNPCWAGGAKDTEEASKRPRKKFGRVLKAAGDSLWDVIHERFDEGMDFILDSVLEYSETESS